MKKIVWLLVSLCYFYSQSAMAESISDKLIVSIVDKQLPATLYKHVDKPWDMGIYSLDIKKAGASRFSSTETHLNLSFPIKAIINSKIKQNVFGRQVNLDCDSDVVTQANLQVKPLLSASGSKVKVAITIPIPNTELNCDGLKLPIKPVLEQLVTENKRGWEKDLESDINALFQQLGI